MFAFGDRVEVASPACFYDGAQGKFLHARGHKGAVELDSGEVGYFYLTSLVLIAEKAA